MLPLGQSLHSIQFRKPICLDQNYFHSQRKTISFSRLYSKNAPLNTEIHENKEIQKLKSKKRKGRTFKGNPNEKNNVKTSSERRILKLKRSSIENGGNQSKKKQIIVFDDVILPSEGSLTQLIDNSIKYIPFLFPILAFFSYDEVVRIFDIVVEFLSSNTWQSVDGRTFQIQTLTPAINGIVVPTASILFATLSGTTITTLRQRQLDIRTCLNMEANEIRTLQSLVESYPESIDKESDYQDICRTYLIQYTARLISECQPEVVLSSLEFKGSMDSEMNGFLTQLNKISSMPPATSVSYMPSYPPPEVAPNPTILSESYGAISRLNSYRSTRISALQSTFPMLHFAIVFALGGSICLAFLMETNQEILLFLNKFQLRTLWTILIGTLAALGVVCYDLSEPFRGSYQVCNSKEEDLLPDECEISQPNLICFDLTLSA